MPINEDPDVLRGIVAMDKLDSASSLAGTQRRQQVTAVWTGGFCLQLICAVYPYFTMLPVAVAVVDC